MENTAGTNFKAGYIDSIGWGNYDTPLLLSFYATEKFTSTGMPYVFVRNYSIGTDSICYDFGDGVISDYKQHSLYHLYKVNGHYQSAYPSVNYNICIKTVNDSGPQSSCQSYAITCVDATVPVITTAAATICSNDSVILNLTGSLNTATKWAWYEGSCGNGAAVDTGSTITVKPLVTTTYFVRGEGGCTMSTVCDSITITVLPTPPAVVTASGPISFCLGDSVILSVTTGVGINHQWKNYGSVISGATLSDYTVYSQGYYNVIVNDSNCFNTSNTLHVTVPCLLPFDSDLKLTTSVPNQMVAWFNDGILHIQYPAIYGTEFSVVVYDLPGKLVFQTMVKLTLESIIQVN
ncbi:MAG: hypothetical protein IPP71_13250 [Bacteroidetes bacterium]|nr:hypothetical protein [Bacteroidota bacterium]